MTDTEIPTKIRVARMVDGQIGLLIAAQENATITMSPSAARHLAELLVNAALLAETEAQEPA